MQNTYLQFVLNNLNQSVVFFNNQGVLVHYNNAVINLWKMNEKFLQGQPNLIEFLETLRENGVYPERDNFREYCNIVQSKLNSKEPSNTKENLLLNTGVNITENIIAIDEGLIVIWEDTTNIWEITYNLNNQKNTYQRIIDKNPLPLIVIASNGTIENYNGKFLETFNIEANILNNKPHIRTAAPLMFTESNADMVNFIGNSLSNRAFNEVVMLRGNKMKITGIALPNSDMFVNFNYIENVDEINALANDVSQSITELHNDLIGDLHNMIGSPLSSIIGFADLISNEYVGKLNIRQKEYIDKILIHAENINKELNYKIQLTEFNKLETLNVESCDLNSTVAYLLHQVKPRIAYKKINIKIDIKNTLVNITSNEELLGKALSLIVLYMINQNRNHAEFIIKIKQNEEKTFIEFEDSSTLPLFSHEDLSSRYDIALALNILKKLQISYEYNYKNRSLRVFSLVINNN